MNAWAVFNGSFIASISDEDEKHAWRRAEVLLGSPREKLETVYDLRCVEVEISRPLSAADSVGFMNNPTPDAEKTSAEAMESILREFLGLRAEISALSSTLEMGLNRIAAAMVSASPYTVGVTIHRFEEALKGLVQNADLGFK